MRGERQYLDGSGGKTNYRETVLRAAGKELIDQPRGGDRFGFRGLVALQGERFVHAQAAIQNQNDVGAAAAVLHAVVAAVQASEAENDGDDRSCCEKAEEDVQAA